MSSFPRGAVLLTLILAGASAARGAAPPRSAKAFVADFYTWYENGGHARGTAAALRQRKTAFAPELHRALLADYRASAKNADEVVGLDFDPFLNTQEDSPALIVGEAEAKGDTQWVPLVDPGDKMTRLTVEVACGAAGCHIVNLHYPDPTGSGNDNLVAILKVLAHDRAAAARK
jgi:hypothetical protein